MWTPQQPTPSSRLFSPSSSSSTCGSKAWSAHPLQIEQNCSSSCLDLATHGDTEAAAIADLGYFARDELAWWWPCRWWWGWGWWTMVMMTRNWPVKVVFMIIWGQVASKCKNANKGGRAWSENQGTGEGIDETFEDALLRNYTVGKLQDVRLQIWLIIIWVVSVLSFVTMMSHCWCIRPRPRPTKSKVTTYDDSYQVGTLPHAGLPAARRLLAGEEATIELFISTTLRIDCHEDGHDGDEDDFLAKKWQNLVEEVESLLTSLSLPESTLSLSWASIYRQR